MDLTHGEYVADYLRRELHRTPKLSEHLSLAYFGAVKDLRQLREEYPEDYWDVRALLREKLLKNDKRRRSRR